MKIILILTLGEVSVDETMADCKSNIVDDINAAILCRLEEDKKITDWEWVY